LHASPDWEKKKDELDSFEESTPAPAVKSQAVAGTKVTALQEPQVKFANKPVVDIEQLLRTKNPVSLNEVKNYQNLSQTGSSPTVEAPEIKFANKDVDLEGIKSAVKFYADEKLKQGSRQISVTLEHAMIQFSNNVISLTINNESQREQLTSIKQDFVDAIRRKLQNNLIGLEIHTSASDVQTKAFKPVDIFKAMSEKNPALLELKKRFDLEIDY
jgi:hypothetical protein